MGTGSLRLWWCWISWFEVLVLGTLVCHAPEPCAAKVRVRYQVGDAFRRCENSSLCGFLSENRARSRKAVRCGEAKGCARLLNPGLLLH